MAITPNFIAVRWLSSVLSLAKPTLPSYSVGQLLDDRGDGAAGAAPGGPEVDQHRLLGLEHLGVEIAVGHFKRMGCHDSAFLLMVERRHDPVAPQTSL